MQENPATIWCNARLPEAAIAELHRGAGAHPLIYSPNLTNNLSAGAPDPQLAHCQIAFGQPDVEQVMNLSQLRWIHVTSAGYARYDRPDLREAIKRRGAILTNSSRVFSDPCAQHALAFMLAAARRIPDAVANQIKDRAWPTPAMRQSSHLLRGQNVLILGMGAIARRLIELLQPLHLNLRALRRNVHGGEPIPTFPFSDLDRLLPESDHVMNILPAGPETDGLFSAERFARMKTGAIFYNIGRGTTVNSAALTDALKSGHLGGAFLDVTDPEPLPPDHPLWLAPNICITPHTAGGHADEFLDSVKHFLENLRRFDSGLDLLDQVI
jgi:phosphoglycerate dehydrogenase-like enzyme